ncbi:hypothetical protein PAECIP111891_02973 [Paenibacillus allorhizoplanae]|uniref:Uncharacterized protein n=1 Tax=Paenibacillus allorhizoplanae TaxID=2905648 RepID=A0ABM9CAR6_9BACL|nr:hypothetical protein PAECIP111891_02973 [Paenibacillus allorhizoplanae]
MYGDELRGEDARNKDKLHCGLRLLWLLRLVVDAVGAEAPHPPYTKNTVLIRRCSPYFYFPACSPKNISNASEV